MRSVGIAELKARLSEYLRQVRRGHPLLVLDRDTPIARIVPFEKKIERLTIRKALRPFRPLDHIPSGPPPDLRTDPVALLLEDRAVER